MYWDILLHYHQPTLKLLNELPVPSEEAQTHLNRLERERNIILPASLREWYTLARATIILNEFSHDDRAIEVEQLGEADNYWQGDSGEQRRLLEQGYLPILVENQGLCIWAIYLDNSDDPPVVLSFEKDITCVIWEPHATTFSEFIYTRIWDHLCLNSNYLLHSWGPVVSAADLEFLHEKLHPEPETLTHPGLFNYRFSDGTIRVLIWENEDHAEWLLSANAEEDMRWLLKTLWNRQWLVRTIDPWTPDAKKPSKNCGANSLARPSFSLAPYYQSSFIVILSEAKNLYLRPTRDSSLRSE